MRVSVSVNDWLGFSWICSSKAPWGFSFCWGEHSTGDKIMPWLVFGHDEQALVSRHLNLGLDSALISTSNTFLLRVQTNCGSSLTLFIIIHCLHPLIIFVFPKQLDLVSIYSFRDFANMVAQS